MPPSSPFAVRGKISAIEANPPGLAPHGDDFFDGRANVVGVHQQHGLIGKNIEEFAERFPFVLVRHDPGMRLRAVNMNPELLAGCDVGGAQTAADHGRARGQHSSLGAMGAARAEFDHISSGRGLRHARRFAGNHGLKINGGEQRRFRDLRLDDRRGNAQDRLSRKKYGALRHGPNVARKPETGQVIKKIVADCRKDRQRAQIRDLLARKTHALQKIQRLIEPGGNQIISAGGQRADKQFKSRARVESCFQVARRHGQFIQVGQQAGILGDGRHQVSAAIMPSAADWGQRRRERNPAEIHAEAPNFRSISDRRPERPAGSELLRASATPRG